MKNTLKQLLALVMALMLALPVLALAEDDAGALSLPATDVALEEQDVPAPDEAELFLELPAGEGALPEALEGFDGITVDGLSDLVDDKISGEAPAALAPNADNADKQEVKYIDPTDGNKQKSQQAQPVVRKMDAGFYTAFEDDWYAVTEDIRFKAAVNIRGNVNLILCDGATFKVQAIRVHPKASLTIWAQSTGDKMGQLKTGARGLGIGAPYKEKSGSITINGGHIVSTTESASAIGSLIGAPTITINGGKVEATCDGPAACGISAGGGSVIINGGQVETKAHKYGIQARTVTINGDESRGDYVKAESEHGGAGIGVLELAKPRGTITISGGKVTAIGGEGAGIGSRKGVNLICDITITGGTVEARSNGRGAGIGGGFGGGARQATIKITGGKVTALGGESAAGIGGGKEDKPHSGGQGASVTISGTADVIAQSGGGKSSAIGHGADDKYFGTITFGDNMKVKAGWNKPEAERSQPVPASQRLGMCLYRWYAHIKP